MLLHRLCVRVFLYFLASVKSRAFCLVLACHIAPLSAAGNASENHDSNGIYLNPPVTLLSEGNANAAQESSQAGNESEPVPGQININVASAAELADALPGIGPSKARAIVEWREQNGPFTTIEQLLEVPGIGPVTLERIRPFIYLGDEEISANGQLPDQAPAVQSQTQPHDLSHSRALPESTEALTRAAIGRIVSRAILDAEIASLAK